MCTTDATLLQVLLFALMNVHDCFGSFYVFLIESTVHFTITSSLQAQEVCESSRYI